MKVPTAPAAEAASSVRFAGKVRLGAVVDCTVTLKLLVAVLWCASVEEQLTLVVPSPNVAPETGTQVTEETPSTASVAVAL